MSILFSCFTFTNTHAGWFVEEEANSTPVSGMSSSSQLLCFPDGQTILITCRYEENVPFLVFHRFSISGNLIDSDEMTLGRFVLSEPFLATVLDSTTFSIAANGEVTPPNGNGLDIFVLNFDRDFNTLGDHLFASAGLDSVTAVAPVSPTMVAVTGCWNGPEGRAFIRTLSVDGVVGWSYDDTSVTDVSSIGLAMASDNPQGLFLLMRFNTELRSQAKLWGFGAEGEDNLYVLINDAVFPYNKGEIIRHPDGGTVCISGYRPYEEVDPLLVGIIDNETENRGMVPYSTCGNQVAMLFTSENELVISSDGPGEGWTEVDSIDLQTSPESVATLPVGERLLLPAPDGGFTLMGRHVSRYGKRGELYYSSEARTDIAAGERLSDSTYAIQWKEEMSPNLFSHSIIWYREYFINEPPDSPHPLSPEDGSAVMFADSMTTRLRWRKPYDPDPESDPVTIVTLRVQRIERPDTLFHFETEDSSYSLQQLANDADVCVERLRGVIWSLKIISQGDTVSQESPWSFSVSEMTVSDEFTRPSVSARLYPNPFNSTLHIHFEPQESGYYSLQLTNLLGRSVYRQYIYVPYHASCYQTIHPTCGSGSYFLTVTTPAGELLHRQRVTMLK